ncbi:hypothetical protein NQ176_g2725 [Zarea fungicola]|uniref:Uncharacterized protein n=1 Tax=Zarea fungicola TaxID=93591 RepID=A0ACC1NN11_9HYPO|nr:hypothetical protein NQ176_g2725 [Lecanicillium fungicola]
MRVLKALLLAAAASVCQGQPADVLTASTGLEKRGDVNLSGTRVAVVTGIVLNQALRDCFDDGLDMARGWAGALYDQWYYSNIPGTLRGVDALVSTRRLTTQYCFTVDAVFNFYNAADAQKFATFIKGVVGNGKRDIHEFIKTLGSNPDVYVEGVDFPIGHMVFGSHSNVTNVNISPAGAADNLSKRSGIGGCVNKCSFSFTSDQTRRCRDQTFPGDWDHHAVCYGSI